MSPVKIIAEAGVNHNGNAKTAFELVDAAVYAGADAVKFQTFKAKNLVIESAAKAEYQKQESDVNESQFDMLKRMELEHETYHDLMIYCKDQGIEFLSTAFDKDSLDFLINDLGLSTLKIASGEITNGPLLLAHALSGSDLIISTGMTTLEEVEQALGVVAFGLTHTESSEEENSLTAFQNAYLSSQGQQILLEKVTLLHCTTEYPSVIEDINLNAMLTLRNTFGLRTGYSDHSEGITVPIAAAAMGATLIEKHFTLDKTLSGPDHKASLDPSELKAMITEIRTVEQLMGDGTKRPRPSELKNKLVARRSLVAARDIKKGDLFTEENLAIKRPGTGKSPMEYWSMLGTESQEDYKCDEVIR